MVISAWALVGMYLFFVALRELEGRLLDRLNRAWRRTTYREGYYAGRIAEQLRLPLPETDAEWTRARKEPSKSPKSPINLERDTWKRNST